MRAKTTAIVAVVLLLGMSISGFGQKKASLPDGIKVVQTTAGPVLTDSNGMTLYTFDRDTVLGKSGCTGPCAQNWPPLAAPAAAASPGPVHDGGYGVAQAKPGAPPPHYCDEKAMAAGMCAKSAPPMAVPASAQNQPPVSAPTMCDINSYKAGLCVIPADSKPMAAPASAQAQNQPPVSAPTMCDINSYRAGLCVVADSKPMAAVAPPGPQNDGGYGAVPAKPQSGQNTGGYKNEMAQNAPPGGVNGGGYGAAPSKPQSGQNTGGYKNELAQNAPPGGANGGGYGVAPAKPMGDWTVVTREDGSKQWAYKGKPLYRWSKDAKPGDTNGNGFNNVWHVAAP
jgi:predicted lipoprotein with Yx(FWY)xxD motif